MNYYVKVLEVIPRAVISVSPLEKKGYSEEGVVEREYTQVTLYAHTLVALHSPV